MGVGGQRHAPATLPQGKRTDTHCIGGCVGPRTGLDGCGKSRPPNGIRSPDRPACSQSLYLHIERHCPLLNNVESVVNEWAWEQWWHDTDRESRSIWERKTYPSATWTTTNLIRTELGKNPVGCHQTPGNEPLHDLFLNVTRALLAPLAVQNVMGTFFTLLRLCSFKVCCLSALFVYGFSQNLAQTWYEFFKCQD